MSAAGQIDDARWSTLTACKAVIELWTLARQVERANVRALDDAAHAALLALREVTIGLDGALEELVAAPVCVATGAS